MSPVLQALNPWFDEYAVKPLSYVNPVAVSDAAASGEAVALDLPPSGAAADPIHSSDGDVESLCTGQSVGKSQVLAPQGVQTGRVAHGPSEATHAQQLAEIERLLRLNDTSCERSLVEIAAEEDDVPLFLRQVRRA